MSLIFSGCQAQRPVVETVALCDSHIQSADNSIAFSRLTNGHWQIWTMNSDGSEMMQVTTSMSDKRYPAWSKGQSKLFYRTNNNHAFSVNLSTGEEKRIAAQLGIISSIVPSPDGDRLLLVRFRTQPKDSANLWLSKLDGKNARILSSDMGMQTDPTWSEDGKKIVYISGHGGDMHELVMIDSDGRNEHRLTNNKAMEVLPAFSPDGKTIAYASNMTGDFEIWLMDSDGANQRRLTNSFGLDTRPCWSPDGKQIMFVSNRSGKLQLWIINSDGGNPRQLTDGAPSMDPAWRRE
jgi:TolB protein